LLKYIDQNGQAERVSQIIKHKMSAPMKRKFSTNYAPRRIRVNTPADKHHSYVSNEVRTSKYSLLTFLPKNIFEQFHGLANFYFLGLIILQAFPEFKQVDIIIPTLPLVLIVLATALKVGLSFNA
jgi:phospholipid-translocating ATPase